MYLSQLLLLFGFRQGLVIELFLFTLVSSIQISYLEAGVNFVCLSKSKKKGWRRERKKKTSF
jgi:hypothetical protein